MLRLVHLDKPGLCQQLDDGTHIVYLKHVIDKTHYAYGHNVS
jgi:hypothetical protein